MILLDANLLIYAKFAEFSQHTTARSWLEDRFNQPGRVGIPWMSLLSFLRLATNPRVFKRPLSGTDAWQQVAEWLALPNVWTPHPTEQHPIILKTFFAELGITANLVPDAHLAALAIEHGLKLCSADGDFSRFPALIWENPLKRLSTV